jgi:small ligand-binding sensory domain FIST
MAPDSGQSSLLIGAAVSTDPDPLEAGAEAAQAAAQALGGESVDLAVVFESGSHLAAPEATLQGVQDAAAPGVLVGCGAGGVLGAGRELEQRTALAVWLASLKGAGEARPFKASAQADDPLGSLDGLPAPSDASAVILLADPYSFPTDVALAVLADQAPAVPVLGGLASAHTQEGTGALFIDGEVCEAGAVGLTLHGIEVAPCVSQGAVPLGREVTITSAEGNVIHELAGRPALQTLEEIIAELGPAERTLIAGGVLIGIVIEAGKPEYEQGDFLVRGVLGVDPENGSLAVGAPVQPGQVLRLHARDAASADEDLRRALRQRASAAAGGRPAGALVFSCNGRGQAMFGACDHDARAVQRELNGAPTAGFFAAGEIGPVGSRAFLHGFTATVAIFPS